MRLLLRVLGTWLIGMALILLIIDGTRSLGASALVWTPLHDTWASIHPDSLAAVREFVATRFFGPVLGPVLEGILGLPGFIVLAVPGVLLALMGRSRRTRVFVRQDQF